MSDFIFDEIPVDWLEPGVFLEVRPNYATAGLMPYPVKNLIISQILPPGTLKEGDIVEIFRPEEAEKLFGQGSAGIEQVKAFRKANATQPLFVTGLTDAGTNPKTATGSIILSGSLRQAAVLQFRINGQKISVGMRAGNSVKDMADELVYKINSQFLPVTAAAESGTVTLTSRHKGEIGNDISISIDRSAQPLPNSLTVEVKPMSGGFTNPDIEKALAYIGDTWFTAVTHPWNDAQNMRKFSEWLTNRYKAMKKRDVHGFVAKNAGFGESGSWGDITNCAFLTCMALNGSPTPSWAVSAAAMGVAVFHLANDPARQLRTLVLPGVEAPEPKFRFTDTECDRLLRTGITSLECRADGTVAISRMITAYKKSAVGVADQAWMDITVPATMSRIRYDWAAFVSLNYPRAKLADDDAIAAYSTGIDADGQPGNAVVTPGRMKASWAGRCAIYAQNYWIEDVNKTVRESIFRRSASDRNRLESRQQVRIIGNLMVLAGSLEFQV